MLASHELWALNTLIYTLPTQARSARCVRQQRHACLHPILRTPPRPRQRNFPTFEICSAGSPAASAWCCDTGPAPGIEAVVRRVDGERGRLWTAGDRRGHVFVRTLCEPVERAPDSFVRSYPRSMIAGAAATCSKRGSRSSSR